MLRHLHFVQLCGDIFERVCNAKQRVRVRVFACRREGLEWLACRTILIQRTFRHDILPIYEIVIFGIQSLPPRRRGAGRLRPYFSLLT